MSDQLDRFTPSSSTDSVIPCAPVSSDPDPDPMHQIASECSAIQSKTAISPTQLNTPAPQPSVRQLSEKQYNAIDFLLAGAEEDFICQRLRINRSTLYRWKYRHPLFVAELNRRHQEIWDDLAGDLRVSVKHALRAIHNQLTSFNDTTKLRAARALLPLVNNHRIAPTAAPANLNAVLDKFLRQQQEFQSAATATPTFTDTQRQSILDQLLTEDETALAADAAEALARRQSRKARQNVAHPSPSSEPLPDSPPLVAGNLPTHEPPPQTPNS